MFNFHKSHRNLVLTSFVVFVSLSTLIALVPAHEMENTQALPSMKPLTVLEQKGLQVYVAENCVACHTQQVRSIEMDKMWGERPSLASDYVYSKVRLDVWRQSPSLLGSERTGPDLTDVGNRQAAMEWHLLHLYNPRIVVGSSIMPSYPWLFEEKSPDNIGKQDKVLPVPDEFLKNKGMKVVASEKALQLIAYLRSLKQVPLPGTEFIPAKVKEIQVNSNGPSALPDGKTLYMNTCAACHQSNGLGLAGAFPPLAGSEIVNDEDPRRFVSIILKGYDARSEFGVMPGFEQQLSNEEIASIVNFERSNWGNTAKPITPEKVQEIRDYLKKENP